VSIQATGFKCLGCLGATATDADGGIFDEIRKTLCSKPAAFIDETLKVTTYMKWSVIGIFGLSTFIVVGVPIIKHFKKTKKE